jgi:hypothetical protein
MKVTLKFGMKQGLEGQTKDQKQGDFMDNFNEKWTQAKKEIRNKWKPKMGKMKVALKGASS